VTKRATIATANSRLSDEADPAIIQFAQFLARQAAREDHERELTERANVNDHGSDLRALLD